MKFNFKGVAVYEDVKPNGKVFYVGIGNMNRLNNPTRANARWRHTVKKHGGYRRRIVKIYTSHYQAAKREIKLIAIYGRENLCNLTDGGDGMLGEAYWKGKKLYPHIVAAMRKRLKGNQLAKGNKFTPEQSARVSKGKMGNKNRLGVKHSKKDKIKIQLGSPFRKPVTDTKTKIIYSSVVRASIAIKMEYSKLNRMLKGKTKNTTNLKFYTK